MSPDIKKGWGHRNPAPSRASIVSVHEAVALGLEDPAMLRPGFYRVKRNQLVEDRFHSSQPTGEVYVGKMSSGEILPGRKARTPIIKNLENEAVQGKVGELSIA